MARGIGIKYITTTPTGSMAVGYVEGPLPLPTGQTGELIFTSEADLKEQIKGLADRMPLEDFLLLHLAMTWLQPNGTFGNINQVTNKQLQFDTTAANVLKIV